MQEREGKRQCIYWPDMKPKFDIIGQETGRLTVIHPVFYYKRPNWNGGVWHYLSECTCGEEIILCNTRTTKSCGCLRKEAVKRSWDIRRARMAAKEPRGERRILKMVVAPKIDRFTFCHRNYGLFECENYSNYLSAICGEEKAHLCYVPDGSCYVAGREQVKLEDN